MLRGEQRHPRGGPDHQRHRLAPEVARLGGLVGDLIHRAEREVDEVEVDHRTHPVHRGAHAGGDHRRLRDRRVDHTLVSEARPDTLDLGEMSTADEQVGSEHEHRIVALHLLGQALLECLADGEDLAHRGPLGSKGRPITPCVAVAGSGSGELSEKAIESATIVRAFPDQILVAVAVQQTRRPPWRGAEPSIGSRTRRHSSTSSSVR